MKSIINWKRVLLFCGIISSLLYIATDIFAASQWTGYSAFSQTVSELNGIGAPTRSLTISLWIIYSLLVYAFGASVWKSAEKNHALRFVAVGLIGKEVLGLAVTLFFPIHLRGIEPTLTDTMHGILTMVGNLFMLLALLSAAAAFRKRFGLYSILTSVVLIVFGVLSGTKIPLIASNLPTPWLGVWERLNIFAYMAWVIVLAIVLLRLNALKEDKL